MLMTPVRVLHVVGSLEAGGVQAWLLGLLREFDPGQVRTDFLVHRTESAFHDDEARRLGANILYCPGPQRIAQYVRTFRRLLQEHGPYDVAHSHVHHYSGAVLRWSRQCGIPTRIAHSHNDTRGEDASACLLRRGYHALMRRWISHHATHGLAASREAALSLFGVDWAKDRKFRVLSCGVDLASFHVSRVRDEIRREFGFADGQFVVGHVGRFTEQKNHAFLVKIVHLAVALNDNVRFLWIGDGPLREPIRAELTRRGLADRVVFAGLRSDVQQVLSAMDAFVFPSLNEGLPLALVEAQAAGLSCLISSTISPEAIVVPPLVRALSLDEGADVWAAALLAIREQARPITAEESLCCVESSPFNLRTSAVRLRQIYLGEAVS